jgi:alkanesulfonate monooxygenase SsuD/methylene tetrahydromethanopterin reductase-like flavin-dependent oxidoreductase (luciferase family)
MEMKSAQIDEVVAAGEAAECELPIAAMAVPESGAHAEMIAGSVAEVADRLAKLLRDRGVIA